MKKKRGFIAMSLFSLTIGLIFSCSLSNTVTAPRYALLIGISDYINLPALAPPLDPQDLKYSRIDAEALKTLLASEASPSWTLTSLYDHDATKAKIKNAIITLLASVPKDSHATVLIYFSGHGYLDAQRTPYLVAADFDPTAVDPSLLCIAPKELYSWISENSPTKNVIVVSDSCYSGGFVPPPTDSSDLIASPYAPAIGQSASLPPLFALGSFGELLAKNAAADGSLEPIAVSAAGNLELSWETSALGHGVFTYYLLESARKGDSNGDGWVSCTEAYSYAARSIEKNWNKLYGAGYYFYPHITGGLRDLVLFKSGG